MERRHFLKFALGLAAGTAMLAASVEAAPLMAPGFVQTEAPSRSAQKIQKDIRPAVTSRDEVDQLKVEQVRWGHGHHHGWHHRHWGWHHRHHWGWRHHHWHHRHWRH